MIQKQLKQKMLFSWTEKLTDGARMAVHLLLLKGSMTHPDESPLRPLVQHLLAELVVAPVAGGASVVTSIDTTNSWSVESIFGRILKPESSTVGPHSDQKLIVPCSLREPVVHGEVHVELEAGRVFVELVGSGVEG